MTTLDPNHIEKAQQLAWEWAESFTGHGDQPSHLDTLTAEDWDAARTALGAGSRSLLFGTSTKVLDTFTQRFKQNAPASSATSPSTTQTDQESKNPAPSARRRPRRRAARRVIRIESPPSWWDSLDPPVTVPVLEILNQWKGFDEALEHFALTIPRLRDIPALPPESLQALRLAMEHAAKVADDLAKESEPQTSKREPPST